MMNCTYDDKDATDEQTDGGWIINGLMNKWMQETDLWTLEMRWNDKHMFLLMFSFSVVVTGFVFSTLPFLKLTY